MLNFFLDFILIFHHQMEMDFEDVLAKKSFIVETFLTFRTIDGLSYVTRLEPREGLFVSSELKLEKKRVLSQDTKLANISGYDN